MTSLTEINVDSKQCICPVDLPIRHAPDVHPLSYQVKRLLSGIYLSARDHYTHMRCTRGTPLNGKKSCGYDFHYDLAAGRTQAEGSVLTPDYTAEGEYATDVLTDHSVKLIKDHNASEVIINEHGHYC